MRRAILALATAIAITVSPLSAVVAVALDCSSTAKNYAQNPTATNSVVMNLCYESNGKGSTAASCQYKLNEANKLFTDPRYELFRGLGNGSIAEYNNCRNASGKNSNSNSGNLNSGVGTVVPRNCSAPPAPPELSNRFVMLDLKVGISAAASTNPVDTIFYQVSTYSKAQGWSGWNSWTAVSSGSELTFAPPTDLTARLALGAYAQNACGNSSISYLGGSSATGTSGVPFWNSARDALWQRVDLISVGNGFSMDAIVSTLSGFPVTVEVLTPSVCNMAGNQLWAKKKGTCLVSVTTARDTNYVPESKSFSLEVFESKKTITCYKKGSSKVTKKVTAVAPKCPTGYSTKK